jgi:site-specific recombinase XerC
VKIREIYRNSRKTYGSPRIHAFLQRQGVQCSKNRVARLMSQHQICAQRKRHRKYTTQSQHGYPKAPNVLAQNFEAQAPNQKWVSDISYVATEEGWLYLAVTTGMRQSEILGLKWTDLDWVNQTLKVERQLVRPEGAEIKFAPPKTKFGKRMLKLGDKSIEVLRNHYESQYKERMACKDRWVESGLIFTTSIGTPIHARNLIRYFKKLLNEAGLPEIRFHDLRHSAASIMLNHGIPVIVVSRRLGHARPSITLDVYGHLIPRMDEDAAQKMDELVTPVELHQSAPEIDKSQNPYLNHPHL